MAPLPRIPLAGGSPGPLEPRRSLTSRYGKDLLRRWCRLGHERKRLAPGARSMSALNRRGGTPCEAQLSRCQKTPPDLVVQRQSPKRRPAWPNRRRQRATTNEHQLPPPYSSRLAANFCPSSSDCSRSPCPVRGEGGLRVWLPTNERAATSGR